MAEMGLPEPEYKTVSFMTAVTVRNGITSNEVINEAINEVINENEKTVLMLISENIRITKPQLAARTGYSASKIDRAIASLKAKDVLERIGSNKTGYWKINDKTNKSL